MAKATLVSWRFTFTSPSIPGPPSSNTLPLLQIYIDELTPCTPSNIHRWTHGWVFGTAISKTLVQKPRIEDSFFWRLCASVKQWQNAGDYSFWLSALVFAHLCSCSHKHRWNTVWWQQPSLIATHDAYEQLLMPLVEQSTCYGVLWHSCGRHSLEGVAWSRPGYPQWTW